MAPKRPQIPVANESHEPPFRLRHVFLLLLMGGLAMWAVPRVRAAFALHSLATATADYGVCMVGPTGASTLRDDAQTFMALVRRRLIESQDGSLPFADCAELAREVSGSVEVERAHLGRAGDFLEYGGASAPRQSLAQLSFGLGSLAQLSRAAWPLERRGYAHLVQPSSHAKEAPHPVAPNAPARGLGLPGARSLYVTAWMHEGSRFLASGHASNFSVLESKDGGSNWQPAPLSSPGVAEHAGRCAGAEAQRSFVVELGESHLMVDSLSRDQVVSRTRIDGVGDVLGTSCDEDALLLSVQRDGRRDIALCAHAGRCSAVPHQAQWLNAHFDVARVGGATVIATARAGIVRVRSSRDGGRSWTPDTVAFDWAAQPRTGDVAVPSRLLALGKELWLYGAANSGQSYPVLFSVDMGTSWYAPSARLGEPARLSASR